MDASTEHHPLPLAGQLWPEVADADTFERTGLELPTAGDDEANEVLLGRVLGQT